MKQKKTKNMNIISLYPHSIPNFAEHKMKSSDAKDSKWLLKFSSRMIIFIKLVYLSSVISLKWQ